MMDELLSQQRKLEEKQRLLEEPSEYKPQEAYASQSDWVSGKKQAEPLQRSHEVFSARRLASGALPRDAAYGHCHVAPSSHAVNGKKEGAQGFLRFPEEARSHPRLWKRRARLQLRRSAGG